MPWWQIKYYIIRCTMKIKIRDKKMCIQGKNEMFINANCFADSNFILFTSTDKQLSDKNVTFPF